MSTRQKRVEARGAPWPRAALTRQAPQPGECAGARAAACSAAPALTSCCCVYGGRTAGGARPRSESNAASRTHERNVRVLTSAQAIHAAVPALVSSTSAHARRGSDAHAKAKEQQSRCAAPSLLSRRARGRRLMAAEREALEQEEEALCRTLEAADELLRCAVVVFVAQPLLSCAHLATRGAPRRAKLALQEALREARPCAASLAAAARLTQRRLAGVVRPVARAVQHGTRRGGAHAVRRQHGGARAARARVHRCAAPAALPRRITLVV